MVFLWTPGHVGIEGNEAADIAARDAAENEEIEDIPIRSDDIKSLLKSKIISNWQYEWNNTNAKLKIHKPSCAVWKLPKLTRREQVALTRLRIGHTHMTSLHLLRGARQPTCPTCREHLTVKHILLECQEFANMRQQINLPNNIENCLKNENVNKTMLYLKATNLLKKL